MRQLVFVLIAAGMLCMVGARCPGAEAARTHEIVAEDYFTIDTISECVVSESGQLIAYVALRWEKERDGRNADIWLVDAATRSTRRLTFNPASDSSPRFSPDEEWIYFLSARETSAGQPGPAVDGSVQVWRVSVDGARLMPITQEPDGVDTFDLSADGETVFYTGERQHDEDEWKELRAKHETLIYGRGTRCVSNLYKVSLNDWRKTKILECERYIREFSIAPDSERIAMLTTPDDRLITNEGKSTVEILNLASSEVSRLDDALWRKNGPSPYGWLESLAWSADSNHLAFGVSYDGHPSEVYVADLVGVNPTIRQLRRDKEITVVPEAGLRWLGSTHDLCVRGEWHARGHVYRINKATAEEQGETVDVTQGQGNTLTFACGKSEETIVAVMDDITHPPDLFLIDAKGRQPASRLTRLNPQVDEWKLPQMQLVDWRSKDGTVVQGILELPPGYDGERPLPMIVELHGGPTAASLLRLRFWIYGRVLFPSRGYALLSPNYRGSTGYGDQFLTGLIGNKNKVDVVDILAGVDAMVERKIADPEKLGVMGWSNGGYLTNCMITNTDRFKAASSGAGVFDVIMQWSAEDTPGHVVNFQQGTPWMASARMLAASPLFAADSIKTPTLIHVGERDARCPPEQSRALFRALYDYLGVPTELITYPGAGHGLTSYKQRLAKMEWDIAWFDRYLPVSVEAKQSDPTTAAR